MRSIRPTNWFMNPFMNRPWLFISPLVNRVNGFGIDSRAHDMKSERRGSVHESIQVRNRTHPVTPTVRCTRQEAVYARSRECVTVSVGQFAMHSAAVIT